MGADASRQPVAHVTPRVPLPIPSARRARRVARTRRRTHPRARPSDARAQPTCAAGPLSTYLAPGFACRLGGFAFDEFRAFLFTDATEGVFTFVPPDDLLDVLPFSRAEADGNLAVGFDFLGLGASAGLTASERGNEHGVPVAQVEFLGHALAPAARLVDARADLVAGVEGTGPGTTFSEALGFGYVHDVNTGEACLDANLWSPPLGFALETFAGACAGGATREFAVLTGGIARIDRDRGRPARGLQRTVSSRVIPCCTCERPSVASGRKQSSA